MTGFEDRTIVACMALRRAHVPDAAVSMLMVVPMHESMRPFTSRLQIDEAR